MSEVYDVEVTVVSQKGACTAGHKAGQKWIIHDTTPAGICLSVYPMMERSIEVLKYGGSYPWSQDPDVDGCVCPDPQNPVVFRLRRIKPQV